MWPLIILADQRLYTLPVALAALSREHVPDNALMMAGAVVTTLPVLILFLALQRFYLNGLLAGSDRKSTRLNSSHSCASPFTSSALKTNDTNSLLITKN